MTTNNPVVSTITKEYKFTQNAFLPKSVIIPLAQEVNVEYIANVKPGDIVKEGDVIASSTNIENQSYIHSSIPGTVEEIIPCYLPNAKQSYGIKINFGGSLSYLGKKIPEDKIEYLTTLGIEKELSDKGVVNTFNITFPTNLGSEIREIKKGSNLVVRLFDEDPYRATDSLITKFYKNEIIKGAENLAKAIDASGVVFVIDQKLTDKTNFISPNNEKSEDIEEEGSSNNDKSTSFKNFKLLEMNIRKYPCGTPREIISAFKKNNLKKQCDIKLTKNDLFIDSSTALETYKAISLKTPSITKCVQFSGNCLQASCILDIKLGTPIKEVIKQIGGIIKNPEMVIVNGDLCGYSLQSLDAPITKYVKSIKVISSRKFTDNQIYACVSCGNCRSACPVNISPDVLYNTTISLNKLSESYAKSSLACISCGLCNTVCPARLPLSQTISVLKDNVTKILKEKNEESK